MKLRTPQFRTPKIWTAGNACAGLIAASLLAALSAPGAIAQEARPAAAVLTMEQARSRAARVSDVSYEFSVRLDGTSPQYAGSVAVSFELSQADESLTLDFSGGSVASLVINGDSVESHYNGHFLTLPAQALVSGTNRVVVSFSRAYSVDGNGLYRFEDPEDGRVYLYTDFEPYHQNRLFPSFDQPDLKARYSAEITAPAGWHVVSITAESDVRERGDERIWIFPASPPVSTYIYALHAGEYHAWESEAGDIPLRLFVRESLARYVDPEEWFEVSRLGFEFFEAYFDTPYPFGKYDQIIVPHFNAGAMENVGAVTFNERYVRRGAVTRADRRALASVVLHEMAHMWFGDLVTMDWWNGLWLNESFATFMSTLAMSEVTEFSEAWQSAYSGTIRAYRADERETTHPIELPIPDTDRAFANFDAITYQKGSATLKQLNYLAGPEAFRQGVSDYLKEHAYGNTTIDDFLGAISAAAGQDLDGWSQDWLLEPGTNSAAVEVQCTDGELSSLTVIQGAPDSWPTYRTHRAQLGLYQFDGDRVSVTTVPVTYSGKRTEVDVASGASCPDLVYPNHGDWDFARSQLDPEVLPVLSRQLQNFADPLVRAMLWQGVWEMVLETRLKVTDYVDFVLANLADEPDDAVARQVLGNLGNSVSYLMRLDPRVTRLGELAPRIEAFLWEQIVTSAPGSDRRIFMFDRYAGMVSSAGGIQRLAAALQGEDVLPDGMELDQDRRWSAVQALSEFDHPEAAKLLVAERERDPTDQGRRAAISAEAGRPDLEIKSGWVDRLLSEDAELSLADVRAATRALFPTHQHELLARFSDQIFAGLATASESRDASYFSSYLRGLVRPLCTPRYLSQINAAIDDADGLHPILRRGLLNTRFAVTRCIAIGEYLASGE